MPTISALNPLEILDSRGRPSISCTCTLASGASATASIPSGASTGRAEARELRDGNTSRYGGLGCRKAIANITGPIANAVRNRSFSSQSDLDRRLTELDGTPHKSQLGANAILAVSIAFSRACAAEARRPLYHHLAEMIGQKPHQLPRLTVNLFSGGKHAGGQVPIQDVLLVPASAHTIDESLAMCYAVYQSAARLCQEKYNARPLTADEGGLAPPFPSCEVMLEDAVASIRGAGLTPGHDVALAIDLASTHFYESGLYHLETPPLPAGRMIQRLLSWTHQFPIVSIEDGLAEDDWENWPRLLATLTAHESPNSEPRSPNQIRNPNAEQTAIPSPHSPTSPLLPPPPDHNSQLATRNSLLILGDDLLCTNPTRIRRAIDTNSANALLLKVNQIGTLTEAAEALHLARSANWNITISARSGETEDDWLADLAVAWAGNQIKIGSITHSERLAKYNRLLAIEAETHFPLDPWPGTR